MGWASGRTYVRKTRLFVSFSLLGFSIPPLSGSPKATTMVTSFSFAWFYLVHPPVSVTQTGKILYQVVVSIYLVLVYSPCLGLQKGYKKKNSRGIGLPALYSFLAVEKSPIISRNNYFPLRVFDRVSASSDKSQGVHSRLTGSTHRFHVLFLPPYNVVLMFLTIRML